MGENERFLLKIGSPKGTGTKSGQGKLTQPQTCIPFPLKFAQLDPAFWTTDSPHATARHATTTFTLNGNTDGDPFHPYGGPMVVAPRPPMTPSHARLPAKPTSPQPITPRSVLRNQPAGAVAPRATPRDAEEGLFPARPLKPSRPFVTLPHTSFCPLSLPL